MPVQLKRRHVLAATTAALAFPHVARAAERVIKLGHNSVPTSQYGLGCTAMAEAVAAHQDLAGVRIEVHGNAEFGDEGPMLRDCRAGTLDMMAGVISVASTVCPEVGILDVPFVFRDATRGRAAFDGALGEEYMAALKAKDVHVLGWLENGLRHLTSNRAVRTPAEMVGLKLRVPQSQVAIESFSALGADARPLAFGLVFEALRTGQFEAQENPIASAEAIKLYEVQKFLCLTGHTYSAGMLVASPDLLEDLTAKQVAALRTCARAGTQRTREAADLADRDGIGRLTKAGMTVITDVDTKGFIAAARPNLDRLKGVYGSDRIERLVKAAG